MKEFDRRESVDAIATYFEKSTNGPKYWVLMRCMTSMTDANLGRIAEELKTNGCVAANGEKAE